MPSKGKKATPKQLKALEKARAARKVKAKKPNKISKWPIGYNPAKYI